MMVLGSCVQHDSDPSLAINRHRRPHTSSAPIVTLCLHARDRVDPIAINKAQQQRRAHSEGGTSYPKPSSARAQQRAALLVSTSQCLGSQYRPALPPAAYQDLAILGSAGALQCPIHRHASLRLRANTCSPTTPTAPPPSHQEAIDCVSEDGVIGAGASSASTSAKRPRPESKKALYLRSLLDFLGASSSGLSPA